MDSAPLTGTVTAVLNLTVRTPDLRRSPFRRLSGRRAAAIATMAAAWAVPALPVTTSATLLGGVVTVAVVAVAFPPGWTLRVAVAISAAALLIPGLSTWTPWPTYATLERIVDVFKACAHLNDSTWEQSLTTAAAVAAASCTTAIAVTGATARKFLTAALPAAAPVSTAFVWGTSNFLVSLLFAACLCVLAATTSRTLRYPRFGGSRITVRDLAAPAFTVLALILFSFGPWSTTARDQGPAIMSNSKAALKAAGEALYSTDQGRDMVDDVLNSGIGSQLNPADSGNLSNLDLSGVDLSDVTLPDSEPSGSGPSGVDLPDVDLSNVTLPDSEPSGSGLPGMTPPDIPDLTVPDIDLSGGSPSGVSSPDVTFPDSDLAGDSGLSGGQLPGNIGGNASQPGEQVNETSTPPNDNMSPAEKSSWNNTPDSGGNLSTTEPGPVDQTRTDATDMADSSAQNANRANSDTQQADAPQQDTTTGAQPTTGQPANPAQPDASDNTTKTEPTTTPTTIPTTTTTATSTSDTSTIAIIAFCAAVTTLAALIAWKKRKARHITHPEGLDAILEAWKTADSCVEKRVGLRPPTTTFTERAHQVATRIPEAATPFEQLAQLADAAVFSGATGEQQVLDAQHYATAVTEATTAQRRTRLSNNLVNTHKP